MTGKEQLADGPAVQKNRRPRCTGFRLAAAVGAFALAHATSAAAAVIPLSFESFFYDPAAPVTIDATGQSALLAESPELFVNYLSNVPGLGDPPILTGGAGRSVLFDYAFLEPPGNDDIFHVALLDSITGAVLSPAFEAFVADSQAGQISFDLSGFEAVTLGLQFELVAGLTDADFTSTLRLDNLRLVVPDDPAEVPEPSTLVLMLSALLGLAASARRSRGT